MVDVRDVDIDVCLVCVCEGDDSCVTRDDSISCCSVRNNFVSTFNIKTFNNYYICMHYNIGINKCSNLVNKTINASFFLSIQYI